MLLLIGIEKMCYKIIINRGEKEIDSPREFEQHFGFLPIVDEFYNGLVLDACLCQCDINQTFKDHNIPFKNEYGTGGDWYVGQLDLIKEF